MILNFKRLVIHNFLSYGHAEIDLNDKSYCLVSGINKSKSDNAKSNGAGKSSWSSAICWALTGETIQGLSSNIKNINIDENLCYVQLEFSANNDNYVVCRYKNPKSDLKLTLNGSDISGKGIRESEAILNQYLPDLTSQLIASIIILGQGLPNKFTANTPSGRKEVLEKLSKSDFMIQDLKNRVNDRSIDLYNQLRTVDDATLQSNTQIQMLNETIEKANAELTRLTTISFDDSINKLSEIVEQLDAELLEKNRVLATTKAELDYAINSYTKVLNKKADDLTAENTEFQLARDQFISKKIAINAKIDSLNAEIKKIESVTDICPTCGQKLPNVIKLDTTELKANRDSFLLEKSTLENKYLEFEQQHHSIISEINAKYAAALNELLETKSKIECAYSTIYQQITEKSNLKLTKSNELATLSAQKASLNDKISACEKDILLSNNKLIELGLKLDALRIEHDNLDTRIKIINQFNTLLKRDFRGYLLSEIIKFINQKCKEYCLYVFDTDKIEFSLDGNNINITYAGKLFENLSGGEKQKIDLIVQFSIRSMMQQYLNFSSNILVLDEIFDQLDAVGCENILKLITKHIHDVNSIYIISHRADELEIPYDCEMIVTKDINNISSIKLQ